MTSLYGAVLGNLSAYVILSSWMCQFVPIASNPGRGWIRQGEEEGS